MRETNLEPWHKPEKIVHGRSASRARLILVLTLITSRKRISRVQQTPKPKKCSGCVLFRLLDFLWSFARRLDDRAAVRAFTFDLGCAGFVHSSRFHELGWRLDRSC